ncbi:MAG: metallophosphoesterase family protein [bacterium]|nr:metallophosphoesterase family protein [bacterium]
MIKRRPIYIIGDVHGHLQKLIELLQDDIRVLDDDLRWIGRDASLWFLGDFFDRGPDGVGVVDLVMRLQQEATADGGQVRALLGNHDFTILSAYRFPDVRTKGPIGNFKGDWKRNGGQDNDLTRLEPHHIEWLLSLPAMARVEGRLLMHADSTLYMRYGRTVEEVNAAFSEILHSDDVEKWDRMLSEFSEHKAFSDRGKNGMASATEFMRVYGGAQIVHGHTPISTMTSQPASKVVAPYYYANGLCVNVDGGMYLGGPGFVHELPPLLL